MSDLTPITREEKLVAAIVGGTTIDETGVTRVEKYLEHIMLGTPATEEPQTRKEHYLAKIAGMDVQLEEPVTRVEKYLASIAGMDVGDLPQPVTRLEHLLSDWAEQSAGELKTVSGSVISVADALAKAVDDLTVAIEPVQSGSGTPSPSNVRPISGWDAVKVTRTGKNLADFSKILASSMQAYGLGITKNSDGTFRLHGTSTNKNGSIALLNYANNSLSGKGFLITAFKVSGTDTIASMYGLRTENETVMAFQLSMEIGEEVDETFKLMVSAETATEYEPYVGDEYTVEFPVLGKNLLDPTLVTGTYYTHNSDGSITVSSADGRAWDNVPVIPLNAGTYTLSANGFQNSAQIQCRLSSEEYNITHSLYSSKPNEKITLSADGGIKLKFGTSASQYPVTLKLQIESGETATTYEPYNNTVYGGTLDVTTGVLTVDRKMVSLSVFDFTRISAPDRHIFRAPLNAIPDIEVHADGTRDYGDICDSFVYKPYTPISASDNGCFAVSDPAPNRIVFIDHRFTDVESFATAVADVKLVYGLATPITIQITPQEITMLAGNNTLWADAGDSTLRYWAQTEED